MPEICVSWVGVIDVGVIQLINRMTQFGAMKPKKKRRLVVPHGWVKNLDEGTHSKPKVVQDVLSFLPWDALVIRLREKLDGGFQTFLSARHIWKSFSLTPYCSTGLKSPK